MGRVTFTPHHLPRLPPSSPSRPAGLAFCGVAPWLLAVASRRPAQAITCGPTFAVACGTRRSAPSPGRARSPAAAGRHEEGFCFKWRRLLLRQALEGIRPDTVRNVLAQAQWQLLRHRGELDRSQPEFTRTPWRIWTAPCHPLRVSQGLRPS